MLTEPSATDAVAGMTAGGRALRAADLPLLVLLIVLTAMTVVVVVVPSMRPAVVNDRLDIGIVTAGALVAFAVAGLDWTRARVTHDPASVLRASAFSVLAMLNGLTLLIGVTGLDAELGATLEDPGPLPLLVGMVARGAAAVLLVLAGIAALRRFRTPRRPGFVLLAAPFGVGVLLVAMALARDGLPPLIGPDVTDALAADPTAPLPLGIGTTLEIVQVGIGLAYLAAALLAHRSYRRSGLPADALFAAGLLVAAFSQVHSAIHPGSYSSVVTVGDMLRLAFYAVLLFAIVAESRRDMEDLRAATREIRRLAEAEFASVALAERARVAREIHDGLAQDLWYAKLKHTRLAQLGAFAGEQRALSDEVETAIDAALAEARNAVAVMREGAGTGTGPFLDVLRRHVDDFADRFAIRADLEAEGSPPTLSSRTQAEILRIVQEALTNVRRHADATTVRVHVQHDGDLRLTISDNGRGFDADEPQAGFGLHSMRQRADLLGATLEVRSERQNGTRVELVVPAGRREDGDGG